MSCPAELEPYSKAYERQIKDHDFLSWMNGAYTARALNATVGNAFLKKGQKAFTYPEKPIMDDIESRPKVNENGEVELTEEEKKKWRERLLLGLMIKQSNFETSKREGGMVS